MRLLQLLRFQPVNVAEHPEGLNVDRPIAMTFDDGYRNNLENAASHMGRYGMFGTLFVVSRRIGKTNDWDDGLEPLLTFDELREWLRLGNYVGSHSETHARLTDLADQDLDREIRDSRKFLSTELEVEVNAFCYPYGACDHRVREMVRLAGYSIACSTRKGSNGRSVDRYDMARINVRRDTSLPIFLAKILKANRHVR
jgi:peptidoglycan/xylan/chitin deacetylase (PgdA/CDA1 family)